MSEEDMHHHCTCCSTQCHVHPYGGRAVYRIALPVTSCSAELPSAVTGAVLETLSVNEENLEHHYTRHERSRSARREDERLPWRKAKR